jgi:hypothetical protein
MSTAIGIGVPPPGICADATAGTIATKNEIVTSKRDMNPPIQTGRELYLRVWRRPALLTAGQLC